MKVVRVQYTVKEEYVAQNKSNIEAVMEELRVTPIFGLRYEVFQLPDETSFMHLNFPNSQEASAAFSSLASFERFRTELKASGPVSPPKAEHLSVVGTSDEIF